MKGGLQMVSDLLLPSRKRKNRNWQKDVLPYVNERLMAFIQEGVLPTVRGMFYALVSLLVINNTKSDYVQLVNKLTDWRENGTIPPHSFVDNSRKIIDINDDFLTPEEYVEAGISYLDNAPKGFFESIPRWHKQPHYVEVWIEKDAMTGTFSSILRERQIRIVPNRGWTGFEFLNNNIERLMKKQNEGKSVHVLYFGDYDPSGDRMYIWLKEKLSSAGIEIKRVAITKEQIDEFNLGHLKNTDPEVMAKLLKDNNTDEFRRNNEGEVFQIELDALQALQPTTLKQLLLSEVDQYFDKGIREEVLNEVSPEDISCLVLCC